MFIVEHDNKVYRVVFKHFQHKTAPGTICSIQEQMGPIEGTDKSIWLARATGATRRAPTDCVNKPLGRELSMIRALRHVTRELRGKILQGYYRKAKRFDAPPWAKLLLDRERLAWKEAE